MNATEELRYLILALQREGNRQLAANLRPLGLTPAQAEALSVLGAYQPLTLGGLGELLVCESGTNPSRIVDRLVTAELVRREIEPTDRRQVELSLTAKGKTVAKQVAKVEDQLHAMLENLIGNQPTGPTLKLLRAMAAHLPAGEAVARRRAAS